MHNNTEIKFILHAKYSRRMYKLNIEIHQDSSNVLLYIKRAELHLEYGDNKSALQDLHYAEKLEPDNLKVNKLLKDIYLNAREYTKARKYLIKLQQLETKLNNNSCNKISIIKLLNPY